VAAVVRLAAITIDCVDPSALAAFYHAAAEAEILRDEPDSAWLAMAGLTWVLRRVDGYRPPTWPADQVPIQMHLEFSVEDLAQAKTRLLTLGASTYEHQSAEHQSATGLVVMRDPAGHPFCIFAGSDGGA
jgi:hypothetical protein